MIRDITWKHVTLILGFFVTVAILSITGHDTGAFVAIGLGVLGALGIVVGQVAGTKEAASAVVQQTNGNMTQLLSMVEAMANQMATMMPAPPSIRPPISPDAASWDPRRQDPPA